MEQTILDKVNARYDDWTKTKAPSHVMTCLLAASKFGWRDDETIILNLDTIDRLKIKASDDSIHDLISRSVEQYRKIVADNHGLKDSNIKVLIMPVGILLSDLDPLWLSSIKSFGYKRGAFAHKSRRSFALSTLPDPKSEWETVKKLLVGLETLDDKIAEM